MNKQTRSIAGHKKHNAYPGDQTRLIQVFYRDHWQTVFCVWPEKISGKTYYENDTTNVVFTSIGDACLSAIEYAKNNWLD